MIGKLFLALFLTALCYLAFPLVYRYTRGKVSDKKAVKIALLNSIIWALFFVILSIILNIDTTTGGSMFAPAFLYYFISHSILVDYNLHEDKKQNKSKEVKPKFETICNGVDTKDASNNTAVIKQKSDNVKTGYSSKILLIKRFQIITLVLISILLLFSIIYPSTLAISKNSKIPPITEFKTNRLTNLDSNETVYCYSENRYNYIYIHQDNKIVIYRFWDATMYTDSNGVRSGYATSAQLKMYFTNIYAGKPSISFVFPFATPVGLSIGFSLLLSIFILSYLIHRFAQEELFYLNKHNKTFIKIKNDYKDENISKYDYNRLRKNNFSNLVLQDKGIFKLFKILY